MSFGRLELLGLAEDCWKSEFDVCMRIYIYV